MSTDKAPGILSLVLIPAIVTLIVTILRLVGEMQGWNDMLFSNVEPGGEMKPGFVGITYLVPIFGFWFGFKLRRQTGQPVHAGKCALRFLLGAAVLVGGFFLLMQFGLITMPDKDNPGQPTGLPYSLALVGVAAIIMLMAWPRLATTLLVYGLLARIPVVIVTWLAIANDWDTHHTKLPAGTVLPDGTSKLTFLVMPQLTFWIAFTIFFGGMLGCLGATMGRRLGKHKS